MSAAASVHAETALVSDSDLNFYIRTFENGAFTGEIVQYPYLPEHNGLERQDLALGDIDGDGKLEIIGALVDDDDFQVYFHEIDDTDGSEFRLIQQRVNHVFEVPKVGDINGDNVDDLVFFRENGGTDGVAWAWIMQDGSIADQGPIGHSISGAGWYVVDLADINSDGTDDIIWMEAETGRVYTWIMQNGQVANHYTLSHPGTMISPLTAGVSDESITLDAVCDIDGDGVPDLISSRDAWDDQFRFWKIQNGHVVDMQIVDTVFSEEEISNFIYFEDCTP
ncbi:MAG: hypothetical protein CMK04_07655 [Ponticaulis sp.]|nr:hypothetical protein [Ponticaulis sp.]